MFRQNGISGRYETIEEFTNEGFSILKDLFWCLFNNIKTVNGTLRILNLIFIYGKIPKRKR